MNYLILLLKLFPYVLQAVIATQDALGHLPGAVRKQALLGSIAGATQLDEQHLQAISQLIDSTVTTLKPTGVLDKPVQIPSIPGAK